MSVADKLTAVAANQEKVYAAGQKSEYDRFWDTFQQNGQRTNYITCFGGAGWTWELFRPKYAIKPVWGAGSDLFRNSQLSGSLKQHLANLNIALDCSELINATSMFYNATAITEIPDLDFHKCTSLNMTFYGCAALETCNITSSAACTSYSNTFTSCTALKNLTIGGEIAASLDLHWSPLSRGSIQGVMASLSDTVTGMTVTFKKTAVEAAYTTAEWAALVATKPNWTVALA